MFLTRIGFGSKAVITGDVTQIDLPDGKTSGLKEAARVLAEVPDIAQCYLTDKDVVRHELVQRIVKAYADYESRKAAHVREDRAARPLRAATRADKPDAPRKFQRRLEGRR